MTSNKPYLIRGLYEWIVDNELTPYLLVDADYIGTQVPRQYVEKGKIVLNLAPRAVEALSLANDYVIFDARFGGVSQTVSVPVPAVLAIYARENGQGMMFPDEPAGDTPPSGGGGPAPDAPGGAPKRRKPSLKVVK